MGECQTTYRLVGGSYQLLNSCDRNGYIQRSLSTGVPALPSDTRSSEYFRWMQSAYPEEQAFVSAFSDCYQSNQNALQCLDRIAQGSSEARIGSELLTATSEESNLLQNIVSLGERALRSSWSRRSFILEFRQLNPQLDAFYMQSVNDVISFYMSHLTHEVPSDVSTLINAFPEYQRRWQAFETRSVTPQSLNPSTCQDISDWVRHELRITGLSYPIPVYVPQQNHVPWSVYEELLHSSFDYLRIFMTPSDLDRLLRPGEHGYHDFSIFISDPRDQLADGSSSCTRVTESYHGEWYGQLGRLNVQLSVNELVPSAFEAFFIHELGHVIVDAFSTVQIFNSTRIQNDLPVNLQAFYNWTLEQAIPISSQRQTIQNSSRNWRDIYALIQSGAIRIETGPLGYNRYIPTQRVHTGPGRSMRNYYGLNNWDEFFAQLVSEHVINADLDYFVSTRGLSLPGPYRARRQLLDQFFSPNGINPEAFSLNNIEAIHRAAGVSIQLPRPEPVVRAPQANNQPPERLSGLSLTFPRFGAQSFYGDVGGTTLHGAGITFGLQGGYLSRGLERGFVGGAGILFDGSFGVGGLENMGMLDFGAYGRLGGNTGPIDLFVEPALGLRHITGNELSDTSFWLGGQAGIGLADGFVNFFFMGRGGLTSNWYSLGGGVSLDFATLIRQSP